MKSNLLTAIVTAVVGALIAYFGCNYFISLCLALFTYLVVEKHAAKVVKRWV